ncbi:hypothetical protein ACS0TY_023186 [Phlomoides rotata]
MILYFIVQWLLYKDEAHLNLDFSRFDALFAVAKRLKALSRKQSLHSAPNS